MTMPTLVTSPLLGRATGVRHGFFTRSGGVSGGLYESLNVGAGSQDDQVNVEENRRRAAAAFGFGPGALCVCDQIHSASVAVADNAFGADTPQADGVVTGQVGLLCAVLTADCAPVLFADAEGRVVAAAHAGWRGALGGIIASSVQAMLGLGARRERIVAAIGPCIGPASYEVGPEFVSRFARDCPESKLFFSAGESAGKSLFDLPGFVLWRLAEAGVRHAEWVGHDTVTREDLFFSNRRAFRCREPDYGRLISAITLEP